MQLRILITSALLLLAPQLYAASPQEEARFLTAVKKAFATQDAKAFLSLYYWEGVPDSIKAVAERTTPRFLKLGGTISLVPASSKTAKTEFVRDGVTYRFNLPVTKQIEVAHASPESKSKGKLTIPVGEKDGKLYITSQAPAK